jgi:hypothetical protein
MADDKVREALLIVARRVMYNALHAEYPTAPEWENYPEVGEYDWEKIERIINGFREGHLGVESEPYDAAYEFLSQRADAE